VALQSEELTIVGDEALYPPETVVNGRFVTDEEASSMRAGIGFDGTIKTLRPEVSLPNGHSFGLQKSYNKIVLTVFESIGGNINGETLLDHDPEQNMGEAPIPFTGDLPVLDLGWDTTQQITIVQDDPFPFILQSISGQITISEEM
jgi:hypothetical protein